MNITQAKWADAAQTIILATIDGIEMSVPNKAVISYLEMRDENDDPVVDQNGEVVLAVDENGANIEVVSYPNIHRQALAKWEAEGNVIEEYVAPTVPPITVVKVGWLRAALARTDKLSAVNAAVAQTTAEKQELWEYATEFRIDDPDIVAIASALSINLRELFDLAETIRIERQGV